MLERRLGLRTGPLSYSVIERFAIRARTALLPRDEISSAVPGIDVFESLNELEICIEARTLRVNYAVNDLPTGIEGMSTFDTEREEILVTLDPRTYMGLIECIPRALFCLCHELGHVCVHALKLVELSGIPHEVRAMNKGDLPLHRAYEDTEWQANAFAAAFAMPAVGLAQLERERGLLTAQAVAAQFNVSFDAARIRLDCFQTRRRELLRA